MKTVAVIEGWAGGPKLSKGFRAALTKNGFILTKHTNQADIIVAHSMGCYFLPKNMRAKLVMLIDPPYWPGQSIIKRFFKMSHNETKFLLANSGWRRLIQDRLLEFYYFLAKPLYTYSVLKNQSHLEFLAGLTNTRVLLVRNQSDEFCSPKIERAVSAYPKYHILNIRYAVLPGYHSNYYTNPQPYIDLLLKEL